LDIICFPAIARLMKRQGFSGIWAALLALLIAACAIAPAANAAPTNITANLESETDRPKAGDHITLAIVMRPKAGWHGYWKTPGDAGFPNEFAWTVPSGVTVSPLRYPVPQRLVLNGLMNHVFLGEFALLTQAQIPKDLPPGTNLPITIKARWLACTDRICVPEEAEFGTVLTVGDGHIDSTKRQGFDVWRQKLARPLGADAVFDASGTGIALSIPLAGTVNAADAWFFPETESFMSYHASQRIQQSPGGVTISASRAEYGFKSPGQVRGVLALKDGSGFEIVAKPGLVVAANAPGLVTIFSALGGAILGGLFLNIMPCVFPIISLKALSLARAAGDARTAKMEAWAYAAGVILICLALGGVLMGLRAAGHAVGWAFQLQDARVIFLLLLLSTAITLNLAGLFGLKSISGGEALASGGGLRGAFWTGALAAFVATPCTGPFMAAALGAALVLPVPAALAIFAGLGLGLALPFLLIAYSPWIRTRLPRPGPWMARFQRWLAVPMALTTVALIWLLGQQTGQTGVILGFVAIAALAILLWRLGKKSPTGVDLRWILAAHVGLAVLAAPVIAHFAQTAAQAKTPAASQFSEERLAALRAEGHPVFLYFTADWCVTCKVNEQVAIDRAEVRAHFKARGITTLVGDWTNGDANIGRFLEKYSRSGVPLYLYFQPGKAEPTILPQILTPALLAAL
jgi:thiol:disulfide interchange protein